jgi:hypothetical protein
LELLGQLGKAKNEAERNEAKRRLEALSLARTDERERESNEARLRFKEKWGYWRYLPLGVLLWVILNALFGKQTKTEELIQNLKDQERATREWGNTE